jgi:hypothetical protein
VPAGDEEAWTAVGLKDCSGVRGAAGEPVRRTENGNCWSLCRIGPTCFFLDNGPTCSCWADLDQNL